MSACVAMFIPQDDTVVRVKLCDLYGNINTFYNRPAAVADAHMAYH